MLSKVYYKLKDKIELIEANIAEYLLQQQGDPTSHRLFYFSLVSRNFKLIALEILSDLIKYFIILFSDPSQSFGILYEQKKLTSCPHSYIVYRQTQQKVRIFSASWFSSVVAATVIVSLIMNLAWGGRPFAQAATFNYGQTSWTGTASTTAYGQHINPTDRTDWNRYASTSDKIIASSTISLGTTSMSNIAITETNDVQFSLGNLGASTSIVSTGTDASIMPCEFNHGGADWTPTDGDDWDISSTTLHTIDGKIEIAGSHCGIHNFIVSVGVTVKVKPLNGLKYGKLVVNAENSQLSGTIDATGAGYYDYSKSNGNCRMASNFRIAADHGGYGWGQTGGGYYGGDKIYGSALWPSTFGCVVGISISGTGGGGVIQLLINNNLQFTGGKLSSNGTAYNTSAFAGGSVLVKAKNISGDSIITANGGVDPSWSSGGGGRIALYYDTIIGAHVQLATTSPASCAGQICGRGSAGTIYLKETSKTGALYLNQDIGASSALTTPILDNINNVSIFASGTANWLMPSSLTLVPYLNISSSTIQLSAAATTTINNLITTKGGTLSSNNDIIVDKINNQDASVPNLILFNANLKARQIILPTSQDWTLDDFSLYTSSINLNGKLDIRNNSLIGALYANSLSIKTADLLVSTSSSINVSGLSNLPANGGFRMGSAHGGDGGPGNYGSDGVAYSYGSITNPVTFGAGGGGAVKIEVINMLNLAGNIFANSTSSSGAGGSVWLVANNFTGSSTAKIQANGGISSDVSGAGGGGRIAIEYATSTYLGAIEAIGGWNLTTGVAGAGTIYLKPGSLPSTLVIDNKSNSSFSSGFTRIIATTSVFDNLTISGQANVLIPAGKTITTSNLTIKSNGTFSNVISSTTVASTSNFKVTGLLTLGDGIATTSLSINNATRNLNLIGADVVIKNLATLTHDTNVSTQTNYIDWSVANFTVDFGGSVDVSGKGYAGGFSGTYYSDPGGNGYGPGGGLNGGESTGNSSGGGHFSVGGASYSKTGGPSYGSTTAPNQMGSGGGGNYFNWGSGASAGGAGGGYIRLSISNTILINGVIKSNGLSPSVTYSGAGAGSGGSIWITAASVANSATGVLIANGGDAKKVDATTYFGGAGAGGSIAFDGYTGQLGINSSNITVNGGIGYTTASVGTKYGNGSPITLGEQILKYADSFNVNQSIEDISSTLSDLFTHFKNLLSYTLTTPVANAASADFTSGPMDTGVGTAYIGSNLKTLAATVNSTSTIKFQISSSNSTSTGWTDFTGPDGASTTMYVLLNGTSTAITDTQHNNKRYLKYKVVFDTFDGTVPSFDDITFTYDSVIYVTTGKWLEGNWYNSNDKLNYLGQVIFDTEDAADVRIQVRTASGTSATPDLANASQYMGPSGSTTYFMLNDSLGYCSTSTSPFGATTTRITCNIDGNSAIGDGNADQWFQWKVWLYSPGGVTPVIHEVGVTYVVNMAPEIEIVAPDDAEFSNNPDVVASTTQRLPHQWDQFEKDDAELISGGSRIDMTGKVLIPLRAKDADTFATNANGSSTAVMPGKAEIKLQYCNLDDCSAAPEAIPYANWSYATTSSFQLFEADGTELAGTTTIPVSASSSPIYYLVWTPGQEAGVSGRYVPNFRLRAVASDHEGGNSYGYAPTGIFQLDARKPHFNQPPHLDASVQVGNIVPSDIHLNMAEDTASTTGFWLYLTENGSLDQAGAAALGDGDGQTGWAPYNSTTTWQLSDWQSTVYTWFKDAYGNLSVASNTPPTPPTELMISDISNPGDANYRLFFSWKKIVAPDFAKYNIWRATSTTQCGDSDYACQSALNFTLLASTTDYIENAYTDTELDSTIRYYYKVTTESDVSNNYNISRFAAMINGKPDGNGASSDVTKPIISKIAVTATSTQAATIQWNTNETAKSLVHYLTETQYLSNAADITACAGGSGDASACERIGTTTADLFTNAVSVGINGYSDNDEVGGKFGPHIVNLNKLEPGTNYYFQVTSRDPSGNESKEYQQTVNGSTTPLVFQTKPGPKIDSGPTESGLTNTTMTIGWTTTLPADSAVIYSTDYDGSNHLVTPIETKGSLSLTQDHKVNLVGLLPDTDYYYYIVSTDPDGNYAMDDNTLGGSTRYFSFRTSFDQAPPTLNSEPYCQPVVTDRNGTHQLVITSSTTEPAILDFDFGTSSDSLTQAIASTTYFDPISSSTIYDANQTLKQGNLAASTTYYFRYTFYDNSDNSTSTNIFSCNTIEPMVAKSELDILQANYDILQEQYDLASSTLVGKIPEDEVGFRIASSAAKMATETDIDELDATSTLWVQIARDGWYSLTRASAWVAASTTEALVGMIKENSIIDRIASTSEELKTDNNATSTDSLATTWVKKAREAWIPESQKGISEAEALAREEAAKAAGTAAGKSSAGSSIIVIDKTDKVAPIISEVKAESITATSAVVSWVTNEEGDSLVKYNQANGLQLSAGDDVLLKEHKISLYSLEPANIYSYIVSSADSSGNLAKSSSFSFTTPELTADELLGLGSSTEASNINPETVQTAATKLMALLGGLSKIVSLGTLETTLSTQYDALDKIAGIIPAPILSGEPAVEITPTTATVRWHTDKAANSLIGYVPEAVYVSSRGDAAYTQTVGKSDELKSDHEVKIYNLKPETTYHFQLSSKAQFGPKATSKDFSFKTRPEALEITTYSVNVVSPTKAIFKWITSAQTNSQTKITPYRGSKLMVDEAKLYLDKTPTTNHETLIDNLIAGVIYNVSLSGVDQKGIRIEKVIPSFSTTKDDLPPEIAQIQTESALSQGKTIGVQTVIAWQTNEPTSCSIRYALGSKQEEKDLVDTTPAETGYSGKHSLVITKFKPGEVYSFRVYCLDSGDNQTVSGTHTILTPKQRESVFDLIVRTMEQTFGWMGNVSK